jgi:hypothetical protein
MSPRDCCSPWRRLLCLLGRHDWVTRRHEFGRDEYGIALLWLARRCLWCPKTRSLPEDGHAPAKPDLHDSQET